jgi:hypothetical protein
LYIVNKCDIEYPASTLSAIIGCNRRKSVLLPIVMDCNRGKTNGLVVDLAETSKKNCAINIAEVIISRLWKGGGISVAYSYLLPFLLTETGIFSLTIAWAASSQTWDVCYPKSIQVFSQRERSTLMENNVSLLRSVHHLGVMEG